MATATRNPSRPQTPGRTAPSHPGLALVQVTSSGFFKACDWSRWRHRSFFRPVIGRGGVICLFPGLRLVEAMTSSVYFQACGWSRRRRRLSISRPAVGRGDDVICLLSGLRLVEAMTSSVYFQACDWSRRRHRLSISRPAVGRGDVEAMTSSVYFQACDWSRR